MEEREVKKELTHQRDLAINDRHRLYGWNCPAVDLDFPMLEYDNGTPIALIEYKKFNAPKVTLSHPSFRAMALLADNSKIPFYLVYYYPENWSYYVVPVNGLAKELQEKYKIPPSFSERTYCRWLYWLRRRTASEEILAPLKKESWPENIRLNFQP